MRNTSRRSASVWAKHLDFMIIDAICLQLSFFIVFSLRFGGQSPYLTYEWRILAVVMGLIDILVAVFGNVYECILRRGYLKELLSTIRKSLIVELILILYMFSVQQSDAYSRIVVVFTGFVFIMMSFICRIAWKKVLLQKLSLKGKKQLLIGGGELAKRYADEMAKQVNNNRVTVYLADKRQEGIPFYAGKIKLLENYLKDNSVDEVVAALGTDEFDKLEGIASLCEKYGTKIYLIPFYHDVVSAHPAFEQVGEMKLINFRATPLDSLSNCLIKRTFDIFASVILIILTSPLMLIAAIGTKLSSPGPILFRQERVGRDKKNYSMLKFRSMRVTGTEHTGWSTNEDPRKTKFGSFIRKCSIDELPQFFNVLKGDMSLIGPRPEIPYHVERFMNEIPLYLVRQQVRPGISGWAQVNGLRGDTSIAERVKYDIWYIENWSMSLDIKIFLKTVFGGIINSEKVALEDGRGKLNAEGGRMEAKASTSERSA